MLTSALAFAILSHPAPAQEVSPAGLISKMLARYSEATKLSGKIVFRQTGGGVTALFDTTVQYARPGKLYISEARRNTSEKSLVIADGTAFTYEVPRTTQAKARERLYEKQNQNGVVYGIGDIYTIAQPGLLTKSPVLDVLISKFEHLRYLRSQWVNLNWSDGRAPASGDIGAIVGDWREYGQAGASGRYRLEIASNGDLKRYSVTERLAVPNGSPITVLSEWTVDVKVGDSGNDSLYRVVKR